MGCEGELVLAELTLGGEPPRELSIPDSTSALGVSSRPGVTCTPSPFFPCSVANAFSCNSQVILPSSPMLPQMR